MEDHEGGYEGVQNGGDDADLYLLKWNSHQNHFANKFAELLDEDDMAFADVTLACEGQFLQAHRLVLSLCSRFFKNLFKVNSSEKGPTTILMANVRSVDVENILHFMYRGQVNVRKDDLDKFLETGEQLQIEGLMGQGQSSSSGGNRQMANQPSNKRRFSEGGVRKAAQQLVNNRNVVRNSVPAQQTQHKFGNSDRTPGMTSRLNATVVNSQMNNHVDPKKSRMSLPNLGAKVDSSNASANSNSRRPSTSSHMSSVNSSTSPSHLLRVDEDQGTDEIEASNGVKMTSMNQGTAATGYDDQGNEVYEILDYEGEDVGEMEMDDAELMSQYGDGGDDTMYYYQTSTSPYNGNNVTGSQRIAPATARYPSIIDGVHFELISADEKRVAAKCKLCPGEKVIRGSGLTSSNFISHLRAFHKQELEEWREKRKSESRRRMDTSIKADSLTSMSSSMSSMLGHFMQ